MGGGEQIPPSEEEPKTSDIHQKSLGESEHVRRATVLERTGAASILAC